MTFCVLLFFVVFVSWTFYVVFLFCLAVAIVGGKKKALKALELHIIPYTTYTPTFISFFFILLLSVLFPSVQLYVYMKEIIFRGQFKLRYGDTGI